MNISQIIVKPVMTEKSVSGEVKGKYSFIVHEDATKIAVKSALEELYGITVKKINILWGLPKYRVGRGRNLLEKRERTRRAIVTLKAGEKLDLTKTKTSARVAKAKEATATK